MKKFKGIEVDENEVRIVKKDFNIWIYNKNNNEIYFENSNGYWEKTEYDKNNKLISRKSGRKE